MILKLKSNCGYFRLIYYDLFATSNFLLFQFQNRRIVATLSFILNVILITFIKKKSDDLFLI